MIAPRFDAVIAGGGLSGLSLAAHLAARGWGDRAVLVVDDPAARPAARRWGFWSAGPELLDAAVSRSYGQVRVHAGGTDAVLPLGRYRYRVVHRPDLERVVRELTAGCPGFRFVTGRVARLHETGDAVEVIVDGRTVRADWVFDSVGGPPRNTPVDARLAFTGWEVRCTRPVFDPDTPVLFDFRTPQDGGTRFRYVLPDDQYQALVELTAFVPRHAHPPDEAARSAALAGYLGEGYQILATESAVLALRSRGTDRGSGRVLRIGARGGLVKASTGYAYHRIQQDSAAIADSLVRHGHPFDRAAARRRYRLLDGVLLEVLHRDPAQLERAFARLFRANPAERVLSFLDEDTGARDELRLIAALPPVPYLRAAARLGLHRTG